MLQIKNPNQVIEVIYDVMECITSYIQDPDIWEVYHIPGQYWECIEYSNKSVFGATSHIFYIEESDNKHIVYEYRGDMAENVFESNTYESAINWLETNFLANMDKIIFHDFISNKPE